MSGIVHQISSTFFPIHYSLIILSFDAVFAVLTFNYKIHDSNPQSDIQSPTKVGKFYQCILKEIVSNKGD